jgi:hypothetical protein
VLGPGDTFYQWGAETGLYYYSHKPPPTGLFYYYAFQFPDSDFLKRRLVSQLNSSKPAIVIIPEGCVHFYPPEYKEVDRFTRKHYHLERTWDHWLFYYRRGYHGKGIAKGRDPFAPLPPLHKPGTH